MTKLDSFSANGIALQYNLILRSHFTRFGKLAGWAHTILFAGDLAKFQKDMQKAEKSSANEKPSEQGDEKENSVNNSDKKRKKAQKNTRSKKSKK